MGAFTRYALYRLLMKFSWTEKNNFSLTVFEFRPRNQIKPILSDSVTNTDLRTRRQRGLYFAPPAWKINRKYYRYIHPMKKNPGWTIAVAIPFALLATILIFMDQQITAVIVNRRENKLKKGCG